jgi:hypothetical protein
MIPAALEDLFNYPSNFMDVIASFYFEPKSDPVIKVIVV